MAGGATSRIPDSRVLKFPPICPIGARIAAPQTEEGSPMDIEQIRYCQRKAQELG